MGWKIAKKENFQGRKEKANSLLFIKLALNVRIKQIHNKKTAVTSHSVVHLIILKTHHYETVIRSSHLCDVHRISILQSCFSPCWDFWTQTAINHFLLHETYCICKYDILMGIGIFYYFKLSDVELPFTMPTYLNNWEFCNIEFVLLEFFSVMVTICCITAFMFLLHL